MEIETLEFRNIRSKKALIALYNSQFSEKYILRSINAVLRTERTGMPAERRHLSRNISSREALHFIYLNGVPDGYRLSQEMRGKLAEFRRELALRQGAGKDDGHEE